MEQTLDQKSVQTPAPKRPESPGISAKTQDQINVWLLRSLAFGIVAMLATLIFLLFKQSSEAVEEFGLLNFITTDNWNPVEDEFGGLSFLYGTAVSSILALAMAAPVSIAIALFINEMLPEWIGKILGIFVEMIAAIPSIVFGLWGIYYLAPFVKEILTPILKNSLGFLPLFQGPSFGIGMLTASLILAIMIVPTITSICREVFKTIPGHQKEAALALGATRLEMIKLSILNPSFSGIMGGVVLGFGRALGETMAVAMVIGNSTSISTSLLAPASTMASVIANEYAEAESDLHVAALCLVGIFLFVITLLINFAARSIVWRYNKKNNR
jgi:phosphate transport system permease protein